MYILPITYNKTASDSKFHVGCHPFSNQHILLTVECPHFLCIFFVCEIGKQNRMSAFIRCSWMDLWKKSSWIKKILDLFKGRKKNLQFSSFAKIHFLLDEICNTNLKRSAKFNMNLWGHDFSQNANRKLQGFLPYQTNKDHSQKTP